MKTLALTGLAMLAVVLTLPVWFPWVLRPALARYGFQYESYTRAGYTRFALTNVRARFSNVAFEADRITEFLPTRWLWSRYFPGSNGENFLTVSRWHIEIGHSEKTQSNGQAESVGSTYEVAEKINATLPALRTWIPAARFTEGTVRFGSNTVVVTTADWQRGTLKATVTAPRLAGQISLEGDFSGAPPFAVSASAKSLDLTSRVRLARQTNRWDVAGELYWKTNRVELNAEFDRENWLPKRAGLKAERFTVPAQLVSLDGYNDPTGAFTFNWAASRFTLEASARAMPEQTNAAFSPPMELSLSARGDLQSFAVEKLEITSPAIQAELSDPIGLNSAGKLTTETATLRATIDLAKLPGSKFTGKLDGRVRVRPVPSGYPVAEFELSGTDVSAIGLTATRANVNGRLNWPALNVDRVGIEFTDGSVLGGSGKFDLKSKEISDGEWRFQGTLMRRFLPDGLNYSNLTASGQISGPLSAPGHSGKLTADGVSVPHSKPFHLDAGWRGEKLDFSDLNLDLISGNSALKLAGAVRFGGPTNQSCSVALKTLTMTRNGEALFRLDKPCRIVAQREATPATRAPPSAWALKVEGLHWIGPDRALDLAGEVEWPQRGELEVNGHGLSLADLPEFVSLPVEGISLSTLDLKANWDDGPIEFQLSGEGQMPALDGRKFSATVKLTGNTNGLVADPVIVSTEGSEILRTQGTLPLTMAPARGGDWLRLEETKPLDFRATTEPNKEFWDFVGQKLGVQISGPKAEVQLSGTLEKPQGTLRIQAALLSQAAATNEVRLPQMEKLRLEAGLEPDRVRLGEFAFEVEGQPVHIDGDMPIRQGFLLNLISTGELPDWKGANGSLKIDDARIEPFARYLPKALSPQGRLSVELNVQDSGELSGQLQIAGAATRPITPLAPIRDIEATVAFSGRRATIRRFTGRMGGQPVSLTGDFALPESGEPRFDLALQGKDVPLVYRPGLLLRSDFNLRVTQTATAPAGVSGDVNLRDGLYLQDLKALVPAGREEPLSRPPYFSVEDEPFADWTLDVNVHGDRFMRVRTPYFRGQISANFRIKGDFREPQALGEARINSGTVRFPFGTLATDQGYASLTSDHPYEPKLFATASSRLYGYNIKMEMTGTASAPYVSFSSTPPLTSEQILLMLAAGELPRNELSFSREKKMGNFALYLGRDIVTRFLGNEDSADRLTVRSGEDVSQEGKSTYYIEYKLADDWSVVGEYDRFNALNAGLKWRIYSR